MLVGVAGQVGVVAFQVQLEDVHQIIGAQEVDGGGGIEVVLEHRRFLGLRLDQELSVQADFLRVVMAHVEELGHVLLLALHLGVPQVLVAFTAAPEHIVLGTKALGDLQGVLQLAAGVRVDVGERGGGGAGDEARVGEQGGGVPQQLDAGGLHVLFDLVDDLVQVLVGLAQGVAFRSDVAIMEAEVLDAELLEELEGVVDLGQSLVLRIGILAVPRALGGAGAERVDQLLFEGVPPCDAEAQPVLHLLAGNNLVGGLPFYVGSYVMHVKIPEGDPIYLPGTVDVAFSIQKIPLTICPDANQQKNEGEADPARFTFTSIGLLDGDVVSGILKREPGEEAGNYNFVLTGLSAADYYTLRLMDDAPQFTILPTEPSWWGGGGERLNPVQQVIERSDGRKMFVTITTQEQLVLSYSELGSVVRNTADDQPRPFTPSLTWNKKTDEVLLRISAEAELNKDAGYVTDSYGNPVYGARTLRFGYMSLRYMHNAGIDAISFSNKNAAVILRLSDFLSDDMEKAIKQAGGNLTTTLFRVTIEPVDLPDGAVTGGWNIRTEMVIDRKPTDISGLLPNAQVAVDMEVVAKLLTNLDRYDEKTFDKHFTLRRGAQTQESVFIAPYQDDELEKVAYPSVLFASRYLLMPLAESGVVDVVMVPIEEDATDGSAG